MAKCYIGFGSKIRGHKSIRLKEDEYFVIDKTQDPPVARIAKKLPNGDLEDKFNSRIYKKGSSDED